jgi:hypothetical protein
MSVAKGNGIQSIGDLFPKGKLQTVQTVEVGSVDSEFGKIEGSILTYKGVCYTITAVSPTGVLVLDTDELKQFSSYGDEFSLAMVR